MLTRFFLTLLSVCGLIITGMLVAYNQSWILSLPSFLFETALFITVCTGAMFAYLYRIDKPDSFVQLYLLFMVVKFFLYGTYTYFMITNDKIGATLNVTFFMALYFIFTGLEVIFLYRKTSSKTKR